MIYKSLSIRIAKYSLSLHLNCRLCLPLMMYLFFLCLFFIHCLRDYIFIHPFHFSNKEINYKDSLWTLNTFNSFANDFTVLDGKKPKQIPFDQIATSTNLLNQFSQNKHTSLGWYTVQETNLNQNEIFKVSSLINSVFFLETHKAQKATISYI